MHFRVFFMFPRWKRGMSTKTLLIMKFTAILLLMACMEVSAAGYGQKITLIQEHAPLETVLMAIERQAGYTFVYTDDQLQVASPVSIRVKDAEINQVLDLCFRNQPLSYAIIDKIVVVKPKGNIPAAAPATTDIRGTIADENNNPLPGVSVMLKGTQKGTQTNIKGEFHLEGVEETDILVFSYIGYKRFEIAAKNYKSFTLRMERSTKALDEAVVMAYGTTTQRFNTGNIVRISAEEIGRQPVTDPLLALQGRMPGVLITQTNGLPGAGVTVQIRGQNLLANSLLPYKNVPLYIVDGVPFPSVPVNRGGDKLAVDGANGQTSPMNSISPSDIESIEILKDADATAIYGSRAANGVVLITTKKGKVGKTSFNMNVYSGTAVVSNTMKLLDMKQYLQLRRLGFANDNVTPTVTNAPDLLLWDTTKTTDFQKLLIGNTAHTTDATASISGGDLRNKFFLSGNYHKETNVFPGKQGYARASVLLNTEHTSADRKFNVTGSVQYSSDANNLTVTDLTAAAYQLPPNYLLYTPSGDLYWGGGKVNPLAASYQTSKNETNNLVGHAMMRYTLIPGLDLKASLGYNKMEMSQVQTTPTKASNPAYGLEPRAVFANNYTQSYIIEPQATYDVLIGKGRLNALVGGTWQYTSNKQPFYVLASGYSSDALLGDPAAASTRSMYSSYSEYKYASLFGRLNYNWKGKYIINGTFRRDGSSRFGPDNRFGNFGAIGAAWIFTEETFFKQFKWLSYGKLRSSYGSAGSDQIGDYGYLSTYSSTGNTYGSIPTLTATRIANNNYRWEVTKKLEVGLETGFLDDRFLFTASWYRNRSGNQLVSYSLSPQAGFPNYQANMPALVQNTGLEFSLNTINIKHADFSWNSMVNITMSRNKLVSYPDLQNSTYVSSVAVGYPLSSVWLYHYIGIDPTTGLPAVADVNKDGNITSGLAVNGKGDYIYAGATYPKYFGGLNNSIRYKNWQLDVFLQFARQQGRGIVRSSYYPPGSMYNSSADLVNDYLQGNFTDSKLVTASYNAAYTAYSRWGVSDAALVDASYIRLKNVNISYSLPAAWMKKARIERVRLYAQGQNLLTITGYKGYDPETQGISLPPLRVFTAGIQCTL